MHALQLRQTFSGGGPGGAYPTALYVGRPVERTPGGAILSGGAPVQGIPVSGAWGASGGPSIAAETVVVSSLGALATGEEDATAPEEGRPMPEAEDEARGDDVNNEGTLAGSSDGRSATLEGQLECPETSTDAVVLRDDDATASAATGSDELDLLVIRIEEGDIRGGGTGGAGGGGVANSAAQSGSGGGAAGRRTTRHAAAAEHEGRRRQHYLQQHHQEH